MNVAAETRPARQPRGIPVGGQFATSARAESGVSLGSVPEVESEEHTLAAAETAFEFPAWKVAAAVASIEKANRRAERAGIPERFNFEVETWEERRRDPETGLDRIEERARLTLDRPTVTHDGWAFAATLTWDEEAGMISRSAPGAELWERPTERLCDVCGKQRDRKDTYVVQRTEPDGTRTQMQVGSDCLAQFMGIRPAGLWMLDFEPETSEGTDEPPAGARVEERHDISQMLGLGLAVVEQYGWVSRSASDERQAATADRVLSVLHDRPRTEVEERAKQALIDRAPALAAEAAEVLAHAREMDGDSDYAINLRALAGAESVTSRNLPMLLSAIASSRRVKEQAAERAARAETAAESQWVGQVKDKVADVPVTITGARLLEGDYGFTTIVSMTDDDGNAWKWFASGNKTDELEVGAKMTMKGTIKGHDEYRGLKETAVTRAKLAPVEDPSPTSES